MSFPRYPKYKDSDVEWLGEVPEHWTVKQGPRIFIRIKQSALPDDQQLSATQKYGVVPQKQFMELEDQKVALALNGLENFKHVDVGDFVISLRSFQGGIENSLYSGCVSPAYTVLRSISSENTRYWSYIFKSRSYIDALQSMTDGIRDGKNISYQQFAQIYLPIVPTEEQKVIVDFLDHETAKIDALVAEQERLIELLKEKRQAVISHAVTKGLNPNAPMKPSGIEWLGDVPAHWNCAIKLKDLSQKQPAAFTNGPFESDLLTSELQEEGVPVIYIRDLKVAGYRRTSNSYVTPEKAAELDKFRVDENDILIAKVGDPPGFCCLYPQGEPPGIICQDVIRLKPNYRLVEPRFICFLLNSQTGIEAINSICVELTRKRFSLADLHSLKLPIPPLAEQREISQKLKTLTKTYDNLIDEAQHAIELLQERRTALISAAVTGQIDVR